MVASLPTLKTRSWRCGYGSKLNQGTAGFSPWLHLPGFHFGHLFLTHSHVVQFDDFMAFIGAFCRSHMARWTRRWVVRGPRRGRSRMQDLKQPPVSSGSLDFLRAPFFAA